MIQITTWKIGGRYLLRRPWQSILMVIGIALGVAVAVAVDLANASARRAFDLSTESVTGKTTHQISGGSLGLDESYYTQLRLEGIDVPIAPIISEYVSSPQIGGRPLQLLGVDPFAEEPFRNYLGVETTGSAGPIPSRPDAASLTDFLTQPGAILVSQQLAQRYGLEVGDNLLLEFDGRASTAVIAGVLQPLDSISRRALDGLILADIATAQELTGRIGKLDRIDLILPDGLESASIQEKLRAEMPPGMVLETAGAQNGIVEQMTAAFRLNLTALSLLALVVGMFLIYNTITFSVVQRRPIFGTLRCLGVTRKEIFLMVILEALVVGVIGAALGVIVGLLMGQGAVKLVTQTINDLYFVVTVRGVQIPINSLIKGAILGISATLLSAALPALEAASVPPRSALSRSGLENKARRAVRLAGGIGVGLIVLGAGLLLIPSRSLFLSFTATFIVIVGFAMLVPVATEWLMRAAVPFLGRFWGTLGRMAPRDVINSLSRTSIAVMALMVAISVAIGVSLMITSFRSTVVTWLNETLQGDIYISTPGLTATAPSGAIEPGVVESLRVWPGVRRADVLRSVDVESPQGTVHIAAIDNFNVGVERIYLANDVPPEEIWEQLLSGSVIVSEPFANRLGLARHGSVITLSTSTGPRDFPVVGIYYDYASTQGTVLMALPIYGMLWDDETISAVALRLDQGVDADEVVRDLQDSLASQQRLLIRANQTLRREVLKIFDRTFAITGALQILATIVAFIGVLSALLSLELERLRELGILRAIGMTIRQLWALILIETGLLGAVAGILAMPTGYVLAFILIYIINRRSFGWSLQMEVIPAPFLEALAVSVIAALLAGLYPAMRMGWMVTSEAIRSE